MANAETRAVRFGVRKASELQAEATGLRKAAEALSKLASDMQASGIKQVEFDGVTKIERAIETAHEYNDAVEVAVRKLKRAKS